MHQKRQNHRSNIIIQGRLKKNKNELQKAQNPQYRPSGHYIFPLPAGGAEGPQTGPNGRLGGIQVEDPALGGSEGEYICTSDPPKGCPTICSKV